MLKLFLDNYIGVVNFITFNGCLKILVIAIDTQIFAIFGIEPQINMCFFPSHTHNRFGIMKIQKEI